MNKISTQSYQQTQGNVENAFACFCCSFLPFKTKVKFSSYFYIGNQIEIICAEERIRFNFNEEKKMNLKRRISLNKDE